jgi:hypothetical protein
MHLVRNRTAIGLTVLSAAALPAAAAIASTGHRAKVAITIRCGLKAGSQSAVTGSSAGAPFGKASVSGVLTPPSGTLTLKTSKGTATFYATGKLTTKGRFAGTWHFTGGTKAYKKIKGSGKISGPLDCQPWKLTGTATY